MKSFSLYYFPLIRSWEVRVISHNSCEVFYLKKRMSYRYIDKTGAKHDGGNHLSQLLINMAKTRNNVRGLFTHTITCFYLKNKSSSRIANELNLNTCNWNTKVFAILHLINLSKKGFPSKSYNSLSS